MSKGAIAHEKDLFTFHSRKAIQPQSPSIKLSQYLSFAAGEKRRKTVKEVKTTSQGRKPPDGWTRDPNPNNRDIVYKYNSDIEGDYVQRYHPEFPDNAQSQWKSLGEIDNYGNLISQPVSSSHQDIPAVPNPQGTTIPHTPKSYNDTGSETPPHRPKKKVKETGKTSSSSAPQKVSLAEQLRQQNLHEDFAYYYGLNWHKGVQKWLQKEHPTIKASDKDIKDYAKTNGFKKISAAKILEDLYPQFEKAFKSGGWEEVTEVIIDPRVDKWSCKNMASKCGLHQETSQTLLAKVDNIFALFYKDGGTQAIMGRIEEGIKGNEEDFEELKDSHGNLNKKITLDTIRTYAFHNNYKRWWGGEKGVAGSVEHTSAPISSFTEIKQDPYHDFEYTTPSSMGMNTMESITSLPLPGRQGEQILYNGRRLIAQPKDFIGGLEWKEAAIEDSMQAKEAYHEKPEVRLHPYFKAMRRKVREETKKHPNKDPIEIAKYAITEVKEAIIAANSKTEIPEFVRLEPDPTAKKHSVLNLLTKLSKDFKKGSKNNLDDPRYTLWYPVVEVAKVEVPNTSQIDNWVGQLPSENTGYGGSYKQGAASVGSSTNKAFGQLGLGDSQDSNVPIASDMTWPKMLPPKDEVKKFVRWHYDRNAEGYEIQIAEYEDSVGTSWGTWHRTPKALPSYQPIASENYPQSQDYSSGGYGTNTTTYSEPSLYPDSYRTGTSSGNPNTTSDSSQYIHYKSTYNSDTEEGGEITKNGAVYQKLMRGNREQSFPENYRYLRNMPKST